MDYQDFYKIRSGRHGADEPHRCLRCLHGIPLSSPTWAPDGKKIAFWGQRIVSFDNDTGDFILRPGHLPH